MKPLLSLWRIAGIAIFFMIAAVRGFAAEPAELERAAREVVALISQKKFDEAASRFDPALQRKITPQILKQAWTQLEESSGPFQEQLQAYARDMDTYDYVQVDTRFENETLGIRILFDKQGPITGIFFVPRQPSPALPYIDTAEVPASVREVQADVGETSPALPVTISLPNGDGPWPGVVLVHESGPHDRDEAVGRCKPFRDLAWGLAERGVAVLRYDKRTFVFRDRRDEMGELTADTEVIRDAVAALEFLRKTEGVDGTRVFLAGHGFGGAMAPRIVAADGPVAGLILLAPSARPLHRVMLDQARYILNLDGKLEEREEEQLARMEEAVAKIDRLTSESASAGGTILGAPTGYWFSLRGNDAPVAAAALNLPTLVLRGDRDYQTTKEDFAAWQAAFKDRANATFREFPALNHLFIKGKGPSSPYEYNTIGRVDPSAIDAIADWIKNSGR